MSGLAFATACTSIGGYAAPPKLWIYATQNFYFQLTAMIILVFQSGHLPILNSIIVALLFMHFINLVKLVEDKYLPENLDTYFNPKKTEITENYYNPKYIN